MFKHPGFFNLVESCRKIEAASDVLSIPHSTEQRGNPTKASAKLADIKIIITIFMPIVSQATAPKILVGISYA